MGTSAGTLVSPLLFPLYVMYFLEDKQQRKKKLSTRTEVTNEYKLHIFLKFQEVNFENSKMKKTN